MQIFSQLHRILTVRLPKPGLTSSLWVQLTPVHFSVLLYMSLTSNLLYPVEQCFHVLAGLKPCIPVFSADRYL
jgi:hypothetical protein